MFRSNDNWERLVAAVLKKQLLWELCHAPSRSPSILSESSSSDLGSTSNPSSPIHEGSASFWQGIDNDVVSSELRKVATNLVSISDFNPPLGEVEDIFWASAKYLGRGTFGATYTAASKENGVKFVVKRLEPMIISVSEAKFKHYMEIVGNVRHENVAALRAYRSSKIEKLMMYDYYSRGSVFTLLHGELGQHPKHVGWLTRVRIAVGAARGIAHIHTQNGGKLVHGNIKSSNILLNSQHYGCVSDLGLANITATKIEPSAWYYAPEVKNTKDVSQASDVYSYGILLLELLTRKPPVTVDTLSWAVDLVKRVSSVKSKMGVTEVFDADLLEYPDIRDEMVKVLEIGMKCVAKSVKKRPKMSAVVKMLDGIDVGYITNVLPGRSLLFIEDCNPTFDYNDIVMALDEVLGTGISWSYHKASLLNGETIVVKIFTDVNGMYNKLILRHVKVLGRINHENVAKLKAYYFSKEEIILVYDCYQESLSDLLHGQAGDKKKLLSAGSRLKIAVGAARGIAHIHEQDGGRLVHGNIKTSNILLSGQDSCLVSDVGLTKMMKPIKLPGTTTRFDPPQEVRDYFGKASQVDDVHSFGVVLLELISGKPNQYKDYGKVVSASVVEWPEFCALDDTIGQVFDGCWHHAGLLELAKDCISFRMAPRPTMAQVVRKLERFALIIMDKAFIELRLELETEDLLLRPAPQLDTLSFFYIKMSSLLLSLVPDLPGCLSIENDYSKKFTASVELST